VKSKEILIRMFREILIDSQDYYFAKFIDEFERLGKEHQKGLLQFLVEECGSGIVEATFKSEDYRKCLSLILMFYSGRDSVGSEPSLRDLRVLVGRYIKDDFSTVEESAGLKDELIGLGDDDE